ERRQEPDLVAAAQDRLRGIDVIVHRVRLRVEIVRVPLVLQEDAGDEFPERDAVAGGPREAARSDNLPVRSEETQASLHRTFRWSAGPKAFAIYGGRARAKISPRRRRSSAVRRSR